MAKSKVWLNYDIVPVEDDPLSAKLIKLTNNEEYDLEVTFHLVKKGIFYFIECNVDMEKTAFMKRIEEDKQDHELRQHAELDKTYVPAYRINRFIRDLMVSDVKSSISHSMRKVGDKEGFKPKTYVIKGNVRKRIRGKSYYFQEKLSKINEEWAYALSDISRLITFIALSGYDCSFDKSIPQFIVENEIEKMSSAFEEEYVREDLENIYCYRKLIDHVTDPRNRYVLLQGESLFNAVLKGWGHVLKCNNDKSKQRTIGTWPNIALGIQYLSNTHFTRHVKNKLEIRMHLAYTAVATGERSRGRGQNNVWGQENNEGGHPFPHQVSTDISHIIHTATNGEIKRAYKCFKLHRKMERMISYERLIEMFQFIEDSIEIFTQENCSPDAIYEFHRGIVHCRSLKRVIELCIMVHRDQLAYAVILEERRRLDIERRRRENQEWDQLMEGDKSEIKFLYPIINPNFEEDGAVVTFLDDAEQVYNEGQKMTHCVGGYVKRAAKFEVLVFHIAYEGEEATISVDRMCEIISAWHVSNICTFRVSQALGPHNNHNEASKKGRELLEKWSNKHNDIVEHVRVIRNEERYGKKDEEIDALLESQNTEYHEEDLALF